VFLVSSDLKMANSDVEIMLQTM